MIRRFLLFVLLSSGFSQLYGADVYVQIERGEKVTLGVAHFACKSSSGEEPSLKNELEQIVVEDILFSQIFSVTQEGPVPELYQIDFPAWKNAGADLLIQATVHLKEDKTKIDPPKLELIASVYEVATQKPIFQKLYRTPPKNARRLAHEFTSDLFYRLTGNGGVFKSRIAFANDTTGHKEIYMMDYDGQNSRQITFDKKIALLPTWSANGSEILYTTYKRNNPDLYLFSLEKGVSIPFSNRSGLNMAASFSPDGNEVVATLSNEGSPHLYLLSHLGTIEKRLTQGNFADTSPAFSPDGRKILFVSDRSGSPQIYLMDKDGTNVTRVTDSGYCDAPTWSPKGARIAYSKGTAQGKHNIILQDLSTGDSLQLTEEGNNENPSFSPDGRFLVYSCDKNKKRELFVASINGKVNRKLLETSGNSTTPSWGP